MSGFATLTSSTACWHDGAQISEGPTTHQRNWWCPACGATRTTYPGDSAQAHFAARTARSQAPAVKDGPALTYSSTQATKCASCGEHKHTPLRIDAMGGYVCLTCIDKKLGGLLGEFGYEDDPQRKDAERYRFIRDADRSDPAIDFTMLMSLAMDSMDAAIDEAMSREAGESDVPVQHTATQQGEN